MALLNDLKTAPCADCGVAYPPWVMQFDHHPDRGEKGFAIGAQRTNVGLARLLAEIAKCDVVCANCHALRTHARWVDGQ